MSVDLDPKLTGRTPWFAGDVAPEQVPQRYRLGRAYVPKGRYLDPEFLQRELDRLFTRTWQVACRVEQLAAVGSYVEYEIGGHSILVVRESTTAISAYYNACRHRGTRLATGCGRVGSFICPFHGWRWNLDGSIRLVLDREEFVPRSDDDLALVRVRTDTWGGFVFLTMDPDAEPLLDHLDPIPRILAPFRYETMRIRWQKGVLLPCNWKTALDGFLEAYHVAGTHPQLYRQDKTNTNLATLRMLESRSWSPTTTYERHAHYSSVGARKTDADGRDKDPNRRASYGVVDPREAYAASVQYIYEDMKGLENERSHRAAEILKTAEVPEGSSPGEVFHRIYREISIAEGYEWNDITPEQWAAAGTAWHVFPTTVLLPGQGSSFLYRARPNGTDPDSCLFEIFALEQVPVAAYGEKHEHTAQFFTDYRDGDFGEVFSQDLRNAHEVTVGMHSPSFDGHRLSEDQEMTVYNHHRVADRYLWTD